MTTTPNLTWKFETHKNVGDNFYFAYKYIYVLNAHKVWRNLKGTFRDRPSNLSHQTRRFAPRRKGFHWTPEGHCGCLVDFLSTTPNSMIFKITTGTCVLKTNFYTHKKKSHVPALILKFLTTTPNLTWNFETWHQILKPIRILVKTLIIYIGSCIHYLCTVKV